jgi:hypothetical protein
MKVLISAPRAGSSYGYEAVHKHNLTLPNVKYIGVEEYLDPNKMKHMSLEQKIKFLNDEKEKGINYTFKHHINYLGNYYEDWFKDFYKEDEVLVLKRRDTWKWFLSFLFQDFTGWKLASFTNEKNLESININTLLTDYNYHTTLKQFFDIKNQLDTCTGTIIYYEDLTHNNTRNKKLSNYVKYESYFDNINIIKEEFDKYD